MNEAPTTMTRTFDFDSIQDWGPSLSPHLGQLFSVADAERTIASTRREYYEEAAEVIFECVCPATSVYRSVIDWINSRNVAAYHGTRIDDQELTSIQRDGLRRLLATDRRQLLLRKLSGHPRWNEATFDDVLLRLGKGEEWGRREGQVHATVSRQGLTKSFNHYLTHGSEFDQRVVSTMYGQDALDLLQEHGTPMLIKLIVPGEQAISANRPI